MVGVYRHRLYVPGILDRSVRLAAFLSARFLRRCLLLFTEALIDLLQFSDDVNENLCTVAILKPTTCAAPRDGRGSGAVVRVGGLSFRPP